MSPYRSMSEAAMSALEEIVHEVQRQRLAEVHDAPRRGYALSPTAIAINVLNDDAWRRLAPAATACSVRREAHDRTVGVYLRAPDGAVLHREISEADLEDCDNPIALLARNVIEMGQEIEQRAKEQDGTHARR